jgi:hypothetical protein
LERCVTKSKPLLDIVRDPSGDAAIRFIETTRGARRPERDIPAVELADVEMPNSLRRLYEVAGRWPRLYHQNRILPPDKLRHDGERLIFYEENQVVYEWATLSRGSDDAPVWWRRLGDPEPSWMLESAPIGAFLLQTLLVEYTMGGAPVSAW